MLTTLPFIVCLLWLVFLLLEWKRVPHATHYLTLFTAVSMVLYLCHAIFFNGYTEIIPYANTIYSFCNIAVFPLYYLYVCRLTQPNKLSLRQWAVISPALLIGLWSALDFLLLPDNITLEVWRSRTAKTIFLMQLVYVSYFGSKKIQKFDRRIMEFYSDTENRIANMTRDMIIILSLCSFISVVFSYIGREYFISKNTALYVPSILFSCCLYAVCYIGYRQSFTADDMAEDEETQDILKEQDTTAIANDDNVVPEKISDYEISQPTDLVGSTDYKRICSLIEEHKLYLREDLRLTDLVMLVGIGRTRLSILINENSGMSFSDFINKYRVNYACRLLEEGIKNNNLILKNIGSECGFTSDSSFYRSFKKLTGMTPTQYRNSHNS